MNRGIAAIVLTRNEERNIERCLTSLSFCGEVIVLDNASADKTVPLAKKLGAKVLIHPHADFSSQRNYAMEQTNKPWLLFVDADEVVPKKLQEELIQAIKSDESAAYFIRRIDTWWGKRLLHGEVDNAVRSGFIRLVKKNAGIWKGKVHEEFFTEKPVGRLNSSLDHYPHPTIKEFLTDINEYSSMRARELYKEGHQVNKFQIFTYPLLKFMRSYFVYRGFLDGPAGFVYSFLMSFHSFLVRAKLYQYSRFHENS